MIHSWLLVFRVRHPRMALFVLFLFILLSEVRYEEFLEEARVHAR